MNNRIWWQVAAGAVLLLGALPASGAGMKEGLWEIKTTMEMPGMPFQPPPTSITHCYTKEDLKDDKGVVPKQDGDCKITDLKTSGGKTSWKMVCKGANSGKGSGEIIYKGDSAYDGNMKFEAEGMTMTSRYKARRLGDCKQSK